MRARHSLTPTALIALALLAFTPPCGAVGITSEDVDLPIGAGGATAVTIQKNTEHVGINTPAPTSRLQVTGTGGYAVDFETTGRIQTGTDSSGGTGGAWVSPTQFVGSISTTQTGIYNNGWNLNVQNDGAVGVGLNNTSPQAMLDVAGGLKLGADASACTGSKAGTLTWISGGLYLCNGSAWTSIPLQ